MQRYAAYRYRMTLFALLGTAAIGSAMPALAQSDTAPVSDVKFDVTAEFNSNVARSDAARAAARDLSRSDQRITPGLSVDLARNLGQTRLWLNGSAGYDFYRRNSQLNRERIGLESGIKQPVGPCRAARLRGSRHVAGLRRHRLAWPARQAHLRAWSAVEGRPRFDRG